jgi:photosystem II stability/assembly factor-like uncharacterized protein
VDKVKLAKLNLCFQYSCCVFVVALIFLGCDTSNRNKWELVHNENSAHAAGVGPILFGDNEEGWALTWAELFRLRDKGRTWEPVFKNPNAERGLYSFTFITARVGFVVGTQKKGDAFTVLILQTSDGGKTWEERPTNVLGVEDRHKAPALQGVAFCGEKSGWAVGEDLILHTKDSGQTWQTQRSNVNGNRLFTVACASSERAWAVGTGGLLLRTVDGGNTWTTQEVGTKEILMRVRFFSNSGWIVGGTNGKAVLFRTHDVGETWQSQQLNVTAGLFDIFFVGNHGWIAGEKGTILKSDDGGQTWALQQTPTKENLTSLFFLSPSQGWVGGDRLTLLRYSN